MVQSSGDDPNKIWSRRGFGISKRIHLILSRKSPGIALEIGDHLPVGGPTGEAISRLEAFATVYTRHLIGPGQEPEAPKSILAKRDRRTMNLTGTLLSTKCRDRLEDGRTTRTDRSIRNSNNSSLRLTVHRSGRSHQQPDNDSECQKHRRTLHSNHGFRHRLTRCKGFFRNC